MTFLDLLLYVLLLILVIYVSKSMNLWGTGNASNKAKTDVKYDKKLQKKKHAKSRLLTFYVYAFNKLGGDESKVDINTYIYRISRRGKKIKYLNREFTPIEWLGRFKLVSLIGSFIAVLLLVLTRNPLSFVFFLSIFANQISNMIIDKRIEDEDTQLEENFPDLYLMLYPRLASVDKKRLSPALEEYLMSLEQANRVSDMSATIRFVNDFRANIEVYASDIIALRHLREKYRSVMVVNFTNLAVQAMNGVDNRDKLLSFKLELNDIRLEQMRKRADKAVGRGEIAVKAMYIILFQFVLLSFWAKLSLSLGGLKGIFGIF